MKKKITCTATEKLKKITFFSRQISFSVSLFLVKFCGRFPFVIFAGGNCY